jgi:hypothetical protein
MGYMETRVPVENREALSPDEFVQVAEALSHHRSIKHAIDWLVTHDPPIVPTGLVTQDEYSHDILVDYPGGVWLVYDTS